VDVGGVAFDIAMVVAALLFLFTAWALITGKHDRYYQQFRRDGIPPKELRDPRRMRKSRKKQTFDTGLGNFVGADKREIRGK
jgi:hypothetical protein